MSRFFSGRCPDTIPVLKAIRDRLKTTIFKIQEEYTLKPIAANNLKAAGNNAIRT